MNDAKHTPGPWHAGAMSGDVFAIKKRGTIPVCAVPEDGSPNWEADARLIAAAPELFEACKAAWNELDNHYDVDVPEPGHSREYPFSGAGELMRRLKAAITKAEGAQ